MNAYVLPVEDDEDYIAELSTIFDGLKTRGQLTIARNRDEARVLLDREFYDFAILDLKIPTTHGTLDLDTEHGKFIFHHARKVTPGTKLLVLTSSPSEDFIADLLTQKHDADIWGEGVKVDTVEFLRKINIDRAPDKIKKVVDAIYALDGIELELHSINLTIGEDRLVRIFAKRFGAMRCAVSKIGAGRSGAKTLRLQLFDDGGALFSEVVAKLGSLSCMQDENRRYESNIVLLNGAVTPRKMAMLEFGAGPTAGLFYQLAQGHDESMFVVMAKDDERAARAVAATARALADWWTGRSETRRTVASIRTCWVKDEVAKALHAQYELDWAIEFESKALQTRWCCVHGDLHGENILVANNATVMIIDYGDIGMSAASYDPVSLELSAVLQQNDTVSPLWPSEDACHQWHNLDVYLEGCPIPDFIRACRDWSKTVAAGHREVTASAYTYLLRQLKYPDTDKKRIIALLQGIRAYMATT